MRVSIALATYNGALYLEQQLESFRSQEHQPDELVVNDDGSTDDTMAILEFFARSAPFAVHIRQNTENLGYSRNFSTALSVCTGDLVFLSDQDDVWFPNKISTVVARAQSDARAQVFLNDAELTDEQLRPTGLTKLGQIRSAWMSEEVFVQGSCVAARRGFLDLVLPVPAETWSHDAWIVMFARGLRRAAIVPQSLQYYRRHSSNSSQFIVNQPRELSPMDMLRRYLKVLMKTDNRRILRQDLARGEVWAARVQKLMAETAADQELAADLGRLSTVLAARNRTLASRLALLGIPRIRRVPKVTEMLYRGEYSQFGRFKTAGRDLLTP